MNCGSGVFHRCCLSSVNEVWGFFIDVYGVKMKGIVRGDKVVALYCMLDQSYIMQLNNYLLNILMKLPFAYMCGIFVKHFLFLSLRRICFFSLKQSQVTLMHVIAPVLWHFTVLGSIASWSCVLLGQEVWIVLPGGRGPVS